MEHWSDEGITQSASRIAGIESRKHELLSKCSPNPLVLNHGGSGYVPEYYNPDPKIENLISDYRYLADEGYLTWECEPTGMSRTFSSRDNTFTLTDKGRRFLEEANKGVVTIESKADIEQSIAHCPSEAESLEHLAGYEVSQDPSKGAHPLCPICWHHHPPTLVESGCGHLD